SRGNCRRSSKCGQTPAGGGRLEAFSLITKAEEQNAKALWLWRMSSCYYQLRKNKEKDDEREQGWRRQIFVLYGRCWNWCGACPSFGAEIRARNSRNDCADGKRQP